MNLRAFCDAWARPRLRRVLTVLAVLGMTGVFISAARRVLTGGSSEFMGYRHVVQTALVDGEDPYLDIDHVRAYPPFFAVAWAPFGLLPVGEVPFRDHDDVSPLRGLGPGAAAQLVASIVFYLAMLTSLTVLAAGWTARASTPPGEQGTVPGLQALTWILGSGIMLNGVARAETDMLVVGLAGAGAYLLFARKRPFWGGAMFGIATAFKLTPGLFGIYLLLRRRWGALGGMIAAGLACTVLVPAVAFGPARAVALHRSWLHEVLLPYAQGDQEFIGRPYRRANQSLTAATVRYLTPYNERTGSRRPDVNVLSLSDEDARSVATAAKLLVLGLLVAAWLVPASGKSDGHDLVLLGLVPPGMLLLSDISHGSQLSIMLLSFGVLSAWCVGHPQDRWARTVGTVTVLACVLIHLIAFPLLKQLSVGTTAVLLTFGTLLAMSWHVSKGPLETD